MRIMIKILLLATALLAFPVPDLYSQEKSEYSFHSEQEIKAILNQSRVSYIISYEPAGQVFELANGKKEKDQPKHGPFVCQTIETDGTYTIEDVFPEGEVFNERQAYIYSVISKGYLDEYILWEIREKYLPGSIFEVSPEQQSRILEYMRIFAIAKK